MKFNRFQLTLAAVASAALVASCGGGGGGGDATPAASGVVISGTAATGAALASAPVGVRCATGSGTATTDAAGTYSVTVTGGVLPCLIEVTGTVNGNTVALHSVAEAGTATGATTTARANVTTVSELIVASLLGRLPSEAFQALGTPTAPSVPAIFTAITPTNLATAIGAIRTKLKDDFQIDLGTSTDPLKAAFTAASGSRPGDDFDKLLDKIGEKITPTAVALLAGQVAADPTQSLATAPGCPAAVSGRYRALGLTGNVIVGKFDFKAMNVKFEGHEVSASIAQNPQQACDFSIGSSTFDATSQNRFAIGTQGAGSFRGNFFLDNSDTVTGYLFPVQNNTPDFAAAASAGPWLLSQSGLATDENPQRVNWLSQLTFTSDGKVSVCDYADGTWAGACANSGPNVDTAVATSNGVELRQGSLARARFWSFRSPAGSATLYGTTRVNPAVTTAEMTSFIMTRQTALAAPAVGVASRVLTFTTTGTGTSALGLPTSAPTTSVYTTDSVDTAAGKFVRSGNNNGTPVTGEVLLLNKPQNGLRVFESSASRVQLPILGAGLTLTLRPTSTTSGFSHSISVSMPTTTPTGASAPAPTSAPTTQPTTVQ